MEPVPHITFQAAGCSDAGNVKPLNQDSYLIKIAETDTDDVALVAVADGMGGLAKGELASATVVRELSVWFDREVPEFLAEFRDNPQHAQRCIEDKLTALAKDLNRNFLQYEVENDISLGTTLTAILALGNSYSVLHVGDSRVYEITDDRAWQMTEDQTFVRREIEAGRMTPEQAAVHPQRNALLECLGASRGVEPQTLQGTLNLDATYLLCSDGFRHVLSDTELVEMLSPAALEKAWDADVEASASIDTKLAEAVDLVKQRKERDNITVVALRVGEEFLHE